MDHIQELTVGQMTARIGAALVVGALVGLERERKRRPAGFRTMILVSVGSAAFMVASHQVIAQTAPESISHAEMSRVLQGLIGGIGFLGAGAVIQSKRAVRGMTTAATIWVTAALGAACGMGLFTLAAVVAGAALFTLIVLELFEDKFFPDAEYSDEWDKEKQEKRSSPPKDAGDGGPEKLTGG
ncbi:MAG: MgtC/SapB family protein [Phycisphaerales bacterium]|nr:MgtC/SapB family protein [Phycisphaerales bacterium]NUQ68792.1 MgtC/SapB family protein [Phycisphaerales bacterium]